MDKSAFYGWMVQVYSDVTERNEAEEALRESEERYALVFQATRDDLYDLDLETDQNYFPTDPRPGTGFESWDGSGSAWAERVHPDDQEDYRAHYVAALKGEEEIFSSEYRMRQDDGSWRWVSTMGVVKRGPGGRALRMIGSNADINDRKEAEQALKQAQEETAAARDLLSDAIESIPDGFIIYDAEDKFVLCNEQYKDILPILADCLEPGITYDKFRVMAEKRKQFTDADAAANRRATVEEHNNPSGRAILRQTNTGVWVQCKDQRTSAGGIVGVRTDVTEIKHAQEELARGKEILETTMNSIDQAISMVDGNHRIIAHNRRSAANIGVDPEFLDTNPLWEDLVRKSADTGWFEPGTDIEAIIQSQLELRSKPGPPITRRHRRPDGLEFEIWSQPLSDGGWVQSVSDITDRLAAENILKQAEEDAEAAAEAKSEIIAMVSHEVRTPMNGVLGMARALLETGIDDEQRGFAETILRSGENMIFLLNNLLDSSKMEAGRLELEFLPFDPRAIVEEAVSVMGVRASEKNLRLFTEFEDGLPPALMGDGNRVQQILHNLVSNAVKFTSEGSVTIALKAGAIGKNEIRLEMAVIDTGAGISADAQDKLFTPYMQGSVATARLHGGTGLGLAICRQLADLMNGEVNFESSFGEGSTFRFIAPFKIAESDAAPGVAASAKRAKPAAVETPALRILLAEDNDINRQVVVRMLEKQGHQVTVAVNGIEALAVFAAAEFDAVLMDRHMPKMNGLDATLHIRAMTGAKSSVPVIGVTAAVNKQEIETCLEAGMNDVITKPVDPNDLEAALSAVADGGPSMGAQNVKFDREDEMPDVGDEPILDPVRLNSLRADLGDAVAAKLAMEFRDVGHKLFEDLKRADTEGDAEAYQRSAHTLKSSVNVIGLFRLANTCRELELSCVNGRFEQARGQTGVVGEVLAEALDALAGEDWIT